MELATAATGDGEGEDKQGCCSALAAPAAGMQGEEGESCRGCTGLKLRTRGHADSEDLKTVGRWEKPPGKGDGGGGTAHRAAGAERRGERERHYDGVGVADIIRRNR